MKLDIELIPSTSFYNNVRAVVTKKQWDMIKSIVYSKSYYTCEICGGVGPNHPVEAHEIWEFDDKNLVQRLIGMISLCPSCHSVKHMGLATIKGNAEEAFEHFCKVNKLTKAKANAHIEKAFKVWEKRSKKNWTLDISILKEYGIDIDSLSSKG